MSENKPLFFDRVAGAFAAATIAFVPGIVLIATAGSFSGHVHPLSWLDQLTESIGMVLAIILVAIFVIAYPVERWFVKPDHSFWRVGGSYAKFIGTLGLVLYISSILFQAGGFATVFFIATPIAALTAFIGRAIYVRTAKFHKANRVAAIFLAALIALPLVLPNFSQMSYKVSAFYPDLQPGEISRGTWDVNETDGSAGSHFSNTGLKTAENVDYVIMWDCEKKDDQKYRIYIQQLDYKSSEEIDVVCLANHESTVPVGTDIANERVKVMIAPINGNEQTIDSDAYAILIPAT
jgi:hypothetical protein